MTRARRGAAAVEFALWLPILILLLSAVIDWGSYMSARVHVARAAMDGCRVGAAVFEPSDTPAGSVATVRARERTLEILDSLGMPCGGSGCDVDVSYCARGTGGVCGSPPFDALLVRITYEHTPFVGLASAPAVIDEEMLMAVENQRW